MNDRVPGTPLPTVDLFVDETAPAGHETPLVEALGSLGFRVRARALPTRRPIEQLAWAVLIVLPLQAFLSALGGKAGEDAHRGLRSAVRKVLRRGPEAAPREEPATVLLQDPETGVRIILGPHLDDAAYRDLRALDLTRFTHGPVRYDPAEARWLSDVDEATLG
ncbi:hypothetical protein ABZ848_35990 [Streptomyces sp. NPDC047081]|uniref:hypothetical protein n=1 Tax=Streptomyces sp. NPDC047081 TaxID=3154706 RepID=UPI00340339A2